MQLRICLLCNCVYPILQKYTNNEYEDKDDEDEANWSENESEYNVEIDSDAFHCELEVIEYEDSSISR